MNEIVWHEYKTLQHHQDYGFFAFFFLLFHPFYLSLMLEVVHRKLKEKSVGCNWMHSNQVDDG